MSEHIHATIDELQNEVRGMEQKVIKNKQLINLLCERVGITPIYPDAEQAAESNNVLRVRDDAFFNKPLNTSIKTFLMQRKDKTPASVEEIHDGLKAGGYDKFPNDRDDAINNLRISLGKSSHTFVRLPAGTYGLADWYGIKPRRSVSKQNGSDAVESEVTNQSDSETQEATGSQPEAS